MIALSMSRILLFTLVAYLGMSLTTASVAFGVVHTHFFVRISPAAAASTFASASALPGNQCSNQAPTVVEEELIITQPILDELQAARAAAAAGNPVSVQLAWSTGWTFHNTSSVREAMSVEHGNLILYASTTKGSNLLPNQPEIINPYTYSLTPANAGTLNLGSVLTILMEATTFAKVSAASCGNVVEGASAQWREYQRPKLVISY
jgi:hypothetical protein